jgi:serralysin
MALGNHKAIGAAFGDERFDCLHSGAFGRLWDLGASRELPFSFATQKDDYFTGNHDGYGSGEIRDSSPTATLTEFTATQKTATRNALAQWGRALNITFVEAAADEGWLMFGKTSDPMNTGDNARTTAWCFYPGGGHQAGDCWIKTGGGVDTAGFGYGQYGHLTLMHEIGHGLGFKHPHDGVGGGVGYQMPSDGSDARDYLWFTIMSYKSTSSSDPDSGYSTPNGDYPQTPMLYDVYVGQQWYGAPSLAADDEFSFHDGTGAVKKNGVTVWTPFANKVNICLYHPDGLINLDNYASPTIDLDPGDATTLSATQVASAMPRSVQIAYGSSFTQSFDDPPVPPAISTGRVRLQGLRI